MLKPITHIQRIFLVGCPRSGTTLLQSLLAAHPSIISFPESQFFVDALPQRREKRYWAGMASHRAKKCAARFLDESSLSIYKDYIPKNVWPVSQFCKGFLNVLDQVALDSNKRAWLEKSPSHLHFIKFIEKISKNSKFIHIVRNGPDNIASMYEARLKYPEHWRLEPPDIDLAIKRWTKDIEISLENMNKENHILVNYEDLVDDVNAETKRILDFLEFPFEKSILTSYRESASSLILPYEDWKKTNLKAIRNQNNIKFKKIFSREQQQYILNTLEIRGLTKERMRRAIFNPD